VFIPIRLQVCTILFPKQVNAEVFIVDNHSFIENVLCRRASENTASNRW